ncbi:hypothetical protein TNCV_3181401 [Trichonephila clavipes]|nr:hypothetical protein TNCV_3181401 [Trichonephila clavipes]
MCAFTPLVPPSIGHTSSPPNPSQQRNSPDNPDQGRRNLPRFQFPYKYQRYQRYQPISLGFFYSHRVRGGGTGSASRLKKRQLTHQLTGRRGVWIGGSSTRGETGKGKERN